MKVIATNGSARKEGKTALMMAFLLKAVYREEMAAIGALDRNEKHDWY